MTFSILARWLSTANTWKVLHQSIIFYLISVL